jgi:hypothetical protein
LQKRVHEIEMRQLLRFITVWLVIVFVLTFGNAVAGSTPVAVADLPVSTNTPAGTMPLVSGWTQTNWPASNSFFSLYAGQGKVFARIWDSLNGGRVFLTTDDGANWSQISSADSSIDILSVVMLNSNILAGTWNGFYLSTDDGTTWNAVTPTGIPADTAIWSIATIDTTLFAGTTGGIYKSLDNGNTWTEASSGIPADARITSIVASGSAIFGGTASNGIFKTTNGGTSWTEINSGLTDTHISQLVAMDTKLLAVTLGGVFVSDNDGMSWAGGASGLENVNCFVVVNDQLLAGTDDNGVFLSVDGGGTWASFSSGIPANTRVWSLAVGSDGIFAGTSSGVWVTAPPTVVMVEREISEPSTFSLKQNYPNPFNGATTISFLIPRPSAVSLKVFNSLGQEVATLIDRKLDPGSYYIYWNGDKYSSGIYFCRLRSYDHAETIKLLLLK